MQEFKKPKIGQNVVATASNPFEGEGVVVGVVSSIDKNILHFTANEGYTSCLIWFFPREQQVNTFYRFE